MVAEEAGKPEPEEEGVKVEAESRKEAVLRPGGQWRGRAGRRRQRALSADGLGASPNSATY